MNALELREVTKQYALDAPPSVNAVSFSMAKGEILTLIGPSGCGKTTTLRLIAGFEQPDAGSIDLNGKTVADSKHSLPPEERGVGMVFQDHALFPHLTVADNVAFGLNSRDKQAQTEQIDYMLKLVGLEKLARRFPHELSGGERQRAALARALAPRPVLVLLDEPFSNLDADRRAEMREQVRAILKMLSATALFVTHDHEEALFMGDRVTVMNAGRLEQAGAPEEIFHSPATRFVAEFMGHTDFLPGTVTAVGIETEIGLLAQSADWPVGTPVEIAFRADDVAIAPDASSPARVFARHFKGAINVYRVRLPSGRLIHSLQPHTHTLAVGTPVQVRAAPGHRLACYPVSPR
ncbi:MAG TPA: ABC transporter ATP-binding protein [Anaerolineales bacterium]|nr:ABC transporter ATP-binding protein [Anaerolineales bacterium]